MKEGLNFDQNDDFIFLISINLHSSRVESTSVELQKMWVIDTSHFQ